MGFTGLLSLCFTKVKNLQSCYLIQQGSYLHRQEVLTDVLRLVQESPAVIKALSNTKAH